MSISNPVSGYSRNKEREFTYEGGSQLWHFCPENNGLEDHVMNCNVVFFADDKAHALDVLRRMFEWFIKNVSAGATSYTRTRIEAYLEALNAGKIKVVKAPTNQFYKVGWASNDNI